jgi:DnaJ family protein C protein 7
MEALRIDPDHVLCQKSIKALKLQESLKDEASNLFKEGKYQEAISKFQECIDLDADNYCFNSTILLNRAIAYSKLKDNTSALTDLN